MQTIRTLLLVVVTIAGVVAVLGGVMLWLFQEKLIFHKQSLDPGTRQRLQEQSLTVTTSDGTTLAGWALPGNSSGVIVYFGGNAEEVSWSMESHAEKTRRSVGSFNYRGFGDSEGSPSAEKLREDALLTYDAILDSLGLDARQSVVVGRSLGTNMAAYVAGRRPVAGLVLVTPFDSLYEIAKRRYWMFPVKQMLRHEFDTVEETQHISAKTLVLLAEDDRVVPFASTRRLLENWKGSGPVNYAVIDDTNHTNIVNSPSYGIFLRQFVKQHLDR